MSLYRILRHYPGRRLHLDDLSFLFPVFSTSSGSLLAGLWMALGYLVAAVLLAITLIGLPFAKQSLKLGGYALWPDRDLNKREAAAPPPFGYGRPAPARAGVS